MSTPKAIEGIEMLADAMGDKIAVGVGTILDAATAADAIHAGAQFVVSPAFDPGDRRDDQALREDQRPGRVHADRDRPRVVGGRGRRQSLPLHRARPRLFQGRARPAAADQADADRRRRCEERRRVDQGGRGVPRRGSALVSKDAMAKKDWATITNNAKAFVDAVKAARAK